MTIGQKITCLRTRAGISQEELAATLGISRQSVSKWEMDTALPQVDKILQLSDLFSVSTDMLLTLLSSMADSFLTKKSGFRRSRPCDMVYLASIT